MQDFAKYRRFERTEIGGSDTEWSLEPISVLFGVLMGAIVVFAVHKVSDHQEMQPTTDPVAEENAMEDSSS